MGLGSFLFFRVVDEVASRSVRTESRRVESSTELGLVLRVACKAAEFLDPVRELTFVPVLAYAVLFEGTAQLGFVAGRVE